MLGLASANAWVSAYRPQKTNCDPQTHSRNPKHQYQWMGSSFMQNRQNPATFEETIKESLPAKISFGGSFDMKGYLDTFREAYKQGR